MVLSSALIIEIWEAQNRRFLFEVMVDCFHSDVHIRLADTAHLMHIFSVALDSRIALFSFSLISLKVSRTLQGSAISIKVNLRRLLWHT